MNRIYRLVWSHASKALVAVAENTRGAGKGSGGGSGATGAVFAGVGALAARRLCLALALAFAGSAAQAAPEGGKVVVGDGTINQNGNSTVVQQSTQNMVINWQSFGIGADQSVEFRQPSSSSIVLNRVLGQDPSLILGNLTANGQVFVVNPNGVLFGVGAQVDVGGLVATTNAISDTDFVAGKHQFTNAGAAGSVVNKGRLTARDGGYIALLAPEVRNEGVVSARLGSAVLAAGNQVTLNLNNGSLVGYNIDRGALKALAENRQLVQADGGQVFMGAKAADALSMAVVNNTGVIEARTFENRNGSIVLLGDMAHGQVKVGGTLDASAPNGGDGGFIDTSAAQVTVADGARVSTLAAQGKSGKWLIDPTDFTIAAGAAPQTGSGIGADTLTAALGLGSVELATTASGTQEGNVNVNGAVSWNANMLTLSAHRNIYINANLNGSGTAQLTLKYNQGDTQTETGYFFNHGAKVYLPAGLNYWERAGNQNSAGLFVSRVITELGAAGSNTGTDLQGINGALNGRYVLGADLDASATAFWNNGLGFAPLGNNGQKFSGFFDGFGHNIAGLTINRPIENHVGLFGENAGRIQNVNVLDARVRGNNQTGIVAGAGSMFFVTSSGSVAGNSSVGGLTGLSSYVFDSSSTATVTGVDSVGGLAGSHGYYSFIKNSHASGNVNGTNNLGGLVGASYGGAIHDSYASGNVSGNYTVGGLVGYNEGRIKGAYATGDVSAGSIVGGLVGMNLFRYDGDAVISNTYSSGRVTATDGQNIGGLIGLDSSGTVSGSFWDTTTSGLSYSAGGKGTGLTTAQMMQQANWGGFLLSGGWWMSEGNTRPLLSSEYSTHITNAHQLQLMAIDPTATYTLANNIDMGELGRASGVWNSATGFVPVGSAATPFTGSLDGGGHTVNGLAINRPAENHVGLFGLSTGAIANLNLAGATVSGGRYTGIVAGRGAMTGVTASGSVTGQAHVGGLTGYNDGIIDRSSSSATVSGVGLAGVLGDGNAAAGGLVGGNGAAGQITNSHATGNVSSDKGEAGGLVANNSGMIGKSYASGNVVASHTGGGLVGWNSGQISGSFATGTAHAYSYAGGLAGLSSHGSRISNSYATGNVTGNKQIGGLVGMMGGELSNAYATGNANGEENVGGLAGVQSGGTISNTYATGSVTGTFFVGGLIGALHDYGLPKQVTNSYWDVAATGQASSVAGTAKTTAQMHTASTFAGWDIATAGGSNAVWRIYQGVGAPLLRSFLTPLTLAETNLVYNGAIQSGAAVPTAGTAIGRNAGTYGASSNQQGYDISGGALNIAPKALNLTANVSNKVYDATTAAVFAFQDDRIGGDDLSFTGSAAFADKNAGAGKAVAISGFGASGSDVGNYTFSAPSSTADITQRALTVSATAVNKLYDGSTAAAATIVADDRIAGDELTLASTGAAFADKNAGSGKAVSVTGISASGTDAANYAVNSVAAATADITARPLAITATGVDKVYDSTLAGSAIFGDDRLAGDQFTVGSNAPSFLNKNAGTAVPLFINGIALAGADAGNYAHALNLVTSANITRRPLHLTAFGYDKVYDGGVSAGISLSLGNRAGSDSIRILKTGLAFSDKNVGVGKTVTMSGMSVGGADGANYTVVDSITVTANITPFALTVSASAANKVYDGSAAAAVTLADDRFGLDALTITGSAGFADKNAGLGKSVNVTGISVTGADAANYTFNTSAATTADITRRALLVSATGVDKVYDGSTAATAILADNRVANDSLTISNGIATFADKNAGAGKTVDVSGISVSGTDAANYIFNTSAATTATITQRALLVSATAANKVYDGGTAATATLADNRIANDSLTVASAGAAFADKNAGSGKAVSVTGIGVSGTDAANYTFNTSAATTADITRRALIVSATAASKVYDGANAASAILADNRVANDSLALTKSGAAFSDKNAGAGKTVNVTGINVTGADAANYTFNTSAASTADITQRALLVSATAANKVYDGATAADATLSDDRVANDSLTVSNGTATFADKNAGAGKAVSVTGISVSGTDAANYTFNTSATTTADITQRALIVSATAASKVYDGANAATAILADNRVANDSLTVASAGAAFADKNAGSGKAVSVTGIGVSGTDAANYTFNTSAATTADITRRALLVAATAANKVYDGAAAAVTSLADNRVADDSLTLTNSAAAFSDKNAGTGKTVNVTGINVTGVDAANYTFNTSTAASADITRRALLVSATAANKVYDGASAATATLADNRVANDSLTVASAGAAFADKNAGAGKAVSVTGISVSGADAANYTFNTSAATTADITRRALLVSATAANKVYDGTTAATATLADNRVASDSLTVANAGAAFADKHAGAGKAVSVTGISVGGADAANYSFNTSAATTANITPRALLVSATAANKVYDGATAATATLSDNRVANDSLTVANTGAAFADKNAASGKAVSVTGISVSGADAANYTFNTSAATTADITRRALMVSATAANKVYDGSTAATAILADNRVASDSLTVNSAGAAFADKNAGSSKAVSVTGISVSGADAGNYTFNTSAATTADITRRALLVSATAANKVYDGATAAVTTLADNRVANDSLTLTNSGAAFNDKNAGTGKAVSVTGINVSGADAANYTFNTIAATSADIARRALLVTASAASKVYDASTAAAATLSDNRIAGDSITLASTAAVFADKNVGAGKTVSVTGISASGADAANYSANTSASASASITPKALALSALVASNKVFDGTTAASASAALGGVLAGDSVSSALGASFADRNAAAGKTVTVNSVALSGADAGNYSVASGQTTTASITPKALTVTANDATRFFDGTAFQGGNGVSYAGLVAGDTVLVLGGTLAFGGSSQGSVNPGQFVITPGGLSSTNYTVTNVDGKLVTKESGGVPGVPAADQERAMAALVQTQSDIPFAPPPDEPSNGERRRLQTVDGGMKLPEGVN
ncbi:MAG: YDG domain-containing protein [Pseudomonadota bacterium]